MDQRSARGGSYARAISMLAALLMLVACDAGVLASHPSTAPPVSPVARGVGSARATSVSGTTVQIGIDNFTFSPATLTITRGTTVTWMNHDDLPHTVTATAQQFSSSGLDTDDQFTYRFTTSGTYTYYCTLHPQMTAQIVVR